MSQASLIDRLNIDERLEDVDLSGPGEDVPTALMELYCDIAISIFRDVPRILHVNHIQVVEEVMDSFDPEGD